MGSGTDFWGRLSFGVEEGVYFLQVKDRGIAPNAPAKYGLACQVSATNNWEVEPNNLAPNMVIPVQPNPTDQTAENYPWGVIFGASSRGLFVRRRFRSISNRHPDRRNFNFKLSGNSR